MHKLFTVIYLPWLNTSPEEAIAMTPLRPTWCEIDLEALRHNLAEVRRVAVEKSVLAVVKADAYGHGVKGVAPALADAGVDLFGVALVEEGIELRQLGIRQPIVVMGGSPPGAEETALDHDLQLVVSDLAAAVRLSEAARRLHRRAAYHLKVDTGMGRLGVPLDQFEAVLAGLRNLDALEMVGLMSHLAVADEPERQFTAVQKQRFAAVSECVQAWGFSPRYRHLTNSAGIFSLDLSADTLVRPGIVLYGGLTGPFFDHALSQQPVMHLVSRIALLKDLRVGEGVSYGHRFIAERPTRIAAIPIGYADGYNRLLSNRGEVLIRGRRAAVAGTVCMDWTLVDVTGLPEAAVGDRVVLLGCDGRDCISAAEWAGKIGTITYEVFCGIGKRVPRIFQG